MTTRWPRGRLLLASSIRVLHHQYHRHGPPRSAIAVLHARHYAQKPSLPRQQALKQSTASTPTTPTAHSTDPVQSALQTISGNLPADPLNPPPSTLPPPLHLPTRGDENLFLYLFRLGRAYGTFYKNGIKAVWYNHRACLLLRTQLKQRVGDANAGGALVDDAVRAGVITRSEFQLLARNRHDIGKLPVFGLLVLVFGEWLPLFVPFMPGRVPGTARIPSQVTGMREKAETRRRVSFRSGIVEPGAEQMTTVARSQGSEGGKAAVPWPLAFSDSHRRAILASLRADQLHHLSTTLTLHNSLWDRVQLYPPSFLLRRALDKRLQYLSQDDLLLLAQNKKSGSAADKLSSDEVLIACEERGLDVLGKRTEMLRQKLDWWLRMQRQDQGSGGAVMAMLFRRLAIREWVLLNVKANEGVSRPNVWEDIRVERKG